MPDIAMWGAQGSGKTTFLAALNIALTQQGRGWTMTAADDASEELLIQMSDALSGKREFPPATQGIDVFEWLIYGRVQQTVKRGRFSRETVDQPVRIGLKLADPTGELARWDQAGLPDRRELVGHLARSRGIIFMFDPIREFERGDAYETTNGLLLELAGAVARKDPGFDGRLPHHVAVCVTKFDEPRVFATAETMHTLLWDPYDEHGFPRVHDSDARSLLSTLCKVSRGGNGDMVLTLLEQHFRADRIKFFVTSAVGFHVNPRTGRFDINDTQNVVKPDRGMSPSRIRGPIHPINIVEPVLWLSEQVANKA